MNTIINDEKVTASVNYAKEVIDFLLADRNRMIDIVMLLMIESGRYEVDASFKEVKQINEGASLGYYVTQTEEDDAILHVELQFTDEQRKDILKDFEE